MHSKSRRKLNFKSSAVEMTFRSETFLQGFTGRIDFTSGRKTSLLLIFSAHLVYVTRLIHRERTFICLYVYSYQIKATPKNNAKLTEQKRLRILSKRLSERIVKILPFINESKDDNYTILELKFVSVFVKN